MLGIFQIMSVRCCTSVHYDGDTKDVVGLTETCIARSKVHLQL